MAQKETESLEVTCCIPNPRTPTHRVIAANGLFAGGGIIGASFIFLILNALGRRVSIHIVCALAIISAAIQGGSVDIGMFLFGRFLNGVSVGMMQVTVPIYQSELSPAVQRGRMVGAHGILVVCGYVRRSSISIAEYSTDQSSGVGYGRLDRRRLLLCEASRSMAACTKSPMRCASSAPHGVIQASGISKMANFTQQGTAGS